MIRIWINDQAVEGHKNDLAELLRIINQPDSRLAGTTTENPYGLTTPAVPREIPVNYDPPIPIEPTALKDQTQAEKEKLKDAVSESQALREQLEKDPSYLPPTPTVLPSKEPEIPTSVNPTKRLWSAEQDTGVQQSDS